MRQPVYSHMLQHVILRVIAKLLIPYILLFALYVQFHADFSPGGGFQAGVIFAAGIILYVLIFGLGSARKVAHPRLIELLLALGLLLYAGVGFVCLFLGGNYLDYGVLAHEPHHGQHLGIQWVEIGVGVAVAAAMTTLFLAFTSRSRG